MYSKYGQHRPNHTKYSSLNSQHNWGTVANVINKSQQTCTYDNHS